MGLHPTTFETWSGPNIGQLAHTRPSFGKVKKSLTDIAVDRAVLENFSQVKH